MMKNLLLITSFLILPFTALCQGTWSQTTSFPDSGRTMALSVTIGDTGYMFLGYRGSSLSYATWQYDHPTNTWTQKASFPGTWRTGSFVFALNGNIFIGCGSDVSGSSCVNDVWKYSPATDSWSPSTSYPALNRSDFAYYTYNNKGYVVFGRNSCTIAESNNFYEFDPVSETWTQLTPYNFGFIRSRAAVYNDKVFFMSSGTSSVLVYDLISGQWSTDYPDVPAYFGNTNCENLFVSQNVLFEYTPSLIKYFHPPSGTWLNSDTAYNGVYHNNPCVMVFGDTVKFICGKLANNNTFTNDIWNFYFGCTSSINSEITAIDTTYFGAVTRLQNTSTVNPSNYVYAYHWQADTLLSGWIGSDTSITPNTFGPYNIQLIADNIACSDTFTKTIIVNPGMWSPKTVFPIEVSGRYSAIVFPIGNFAYMGFGQDCNSTALNDFYKYDPSTHKITSLNVFPDSTLSAVSAITYNGKGYILGGSTNVFPYKSNKFYEYDPVADTWTRLPDFPGPSRAYACTFVINGDLYLCLGGSAETYKYNFSTSVWTSLAPHPQLTYGNHAFTYNNKGLIMINGNSLTQLWQYDPLTDAWSIYATNFLNENLTGVSAALIGNKIWIGYGKATGNAMYDYRNSTAIYDLISGIVTPGPANFAYATYFSPRYLSNFFQLNGTIYSCFGKNPTGCDNTISRFETGACVNLPFFKATELDEAGLGIPIQLSNSASFNLPSNPIPFQLVVDGTLVSNTITAPSTTIDFRICGEHKTQFVMNEANCTDTFTTYLTAHPVFNILSLPDLPLGAFNIRHTMNSFSINGKGYMGMGNKYVEILSAAYKDWYEYDPALNSWNAKSSLPLSASLTTGSSCFTDGTHGYISSGTDGCFTNSSCFLNDTWMYDPVVDSWTAKADWPLTGSYVSRADASGDTAFAGLGYYTFSGNDKIYKYSFSGDTWTNANWPYGIGTVPAVFNYNNEFYAGYSPLLGSGNSAGLYKYNQANGSWSGQLLKSGDLTQSYFTKVAGDEVYIFDYAYVNKIDMVKKKIIPIQALSIPGDTSNEFSAGFSIGDQVYFSLLNLDFGSPRLGNHFYLYDLAAPVCDLDSLILNAPVTENKNSLLLTVSPNPASEKLYVKIAGNINETDYIQITDATGRNVHQTQIISREAKIDVSSFTRGIYIVTVKDRYGILLASEKFIIAR